MQYKIFKGNNCILSINSASLGPLSMYLKEVNQRNEKGMKQLKGEVWGPYWARGDLED